MTLQRSRPVRVRRRPLDRLWIVAVNGGAVRVMGVSGNRSGLVVLREVTAIAWWRTTAGPNSLPQGPSRQRHAPARPGIELRSAPYELAHERFIARIAAMLNEDNRARQFDELILITGCGPSERLCEALGSATRARVRNTLVRDLVHESLPVIFELLVETGLLPGPAHGIDHCLLSRGARASSNTTAR